MVALPGHASVEPSTEIILAACESVLGSGGSPRWRALEDSSGIDNHLYLVRDQRSALLFRFSAAPHAEEIHRKEMAASDAAASAGVRTPSYFQQGTVAEFSFLVREYIDGDSPVRSEHASAAWRALGEYLAVLQTIDSSGFGWNDVYAPLLGTPVDRYVAWLHRQGEELAGDVLLDTYSVLRSADKQRVLSALDRCALDERSASLCHGNFSLNNLVRGPEAVFYLIDWGNAFSGPQPDFDLAELAVWYEADQWLTPLAEGYGSTVDELAALLETTVLLQTWRVLWSIRRDIARLGDDWRNAPYARRCLELLPRLLCEL